MVRSHQPGQPFSDRSCPKTSTGNRSRRSHLLCGSIVARQNDDTTGRIRLHPIAVELIA